MGAFELHPQLAKDTLPIGQLGLNKVLLFNDSRYRWLILVPQRAAITELHELTPLDQTMMTFEMTEVAAALKDQTQCHKINIGALGNMVPQLHIHIVARGPDDPAWPGPVWGHSSAAPYQGDSAKAFIAAFSKRFGGDISA